MKKILITGGSGFIGTNFINYLDTKNKFKIYNIDKISSVSTPEKFKKINNKKKYQFIKLNLINFLNLKKCIKKIKPDIIFVIDEASDPNGTHGIIRDLCARALKNIKFGGEIFGYRVWSEPYNKDESDVVVEFNEDVMKQKERLILFHESQINDPAHPHQDDDFITMIKKSNRVASKNVGSKYKYAELYKRIY